MKKLTTILASFGLLFSILSTNVSAFDGISVGGVWSMATIDASGTETDTDAVKVIETNSRSKSSDADFGSYFIEYTSTAGHTIGMEFIPGEADIDSATRTDTASATASGGAENDTGTYTAKAIISDHSTLYVEPTKMISDTFGVYIKGGVSKVTIDVSQTGTTSLVKDKDVYGVATGFGAKKYFGDSIFAKLEYMETDYANYSSTTSGTSTISSVQADIDSKATRLSLGFNF
jgi:hypothetical protein